MMKRIALALALLAAGGCASAKPPRTDAADAKVTALVTAPETTVVHLWATWCPNSRAELASGGWRRLVDANPRTRFVFVTIWSGWAGGPILQEYGIGGQANVTVVDATDASDAAADRRKSFLGQRLTWVPTTWVFTKGTLRYAFDYGEVRFPLLQQCIDDTTKDWHR
jgi:thiol-disulfide isomerase/thioredoxin